MPRRPTKWVGRPNMTVDSEPDVTVAFRFIVTSHSGRTRPISQLSRISGHDTGTMSYRSALVLRVSPTGRGSCLIFCLRQTMPAPRIAMRKIKEVLRLKLDAKLPSTEEKRKRHLRRDFRWSKLHAFPLATSAGRSILAWYGR